MGDKSGVQKWTTSLECLIEYYFSKLSFFAVKELNYLFSLSKLQQSFTYFVRDKKIVCILIIKSNQRHFLHLIWAEIISVKVMKYSNDNNPY